MSFERKWETERFITLQRGDVRAVCRNSRLLSDDGERHAALEIGTCLRSQTIVEAVAVDLKLFSISRLAGSRATGNAGQSRELAREAGKYPRRSCRAQIRREQNRACGSGNTPPSCLARY